MSPIDTVHAELAARGLPRNYLRRVRGEFAAHIEDAAAYLIDAGHPVALARTMASEQFGDPSTLATAFFEQYRRSSFIARHPLAVSLAAPPLMFIMLGMAHLLTLAVLYAYVSSSWIQTAQHVGPALVSLAGALLAVLMLRRRLGHRRWLVLAVLIFIAVCMTSDLSVRPRPGGELAVRMRVANCIWWPPYYLFGLGFVSTSTPSGQISFHSWTWRQKGVLNKRSTHAR